MKKQNKSIFKIGDKIRIDHKQIGFVEDSRSEGFIQNFENKYGFQFLVMDIDFSYLGGDDMPLLKITSVQTKEAVPGQWAQLWFIKDKFK